MKTGGTHAGWRCWAVHHANAESSTIASVLMCLNRKTLYATRGRPDTAQYGTYPLRVRPETG